MQEVRQLAVTPFELSSTRPDIMDRFEGLYQQLAILKIEAKLLIDGRFMTHEIDPPDVDFIVSVEEYFYETCSEEQRTILDWIRDKQEIQNNYLCHCYLVPEFTPQHPDYFPEGWNRQWWIDLYTHKGHPPIHGLAEVEIV